MSFFGCDGFIETHQWGQWEQFSVRMMYWSFSKSLGEGIESRQKRKCEECGVVEERTIS